LLTVLERFPACSVAEAEPCGCTYCSINGFHVLVWLQ